MSRKVALALLIALAEMGQINPGATQGDPRIQVITYTPDTTVTLQAAVGYAVVVELSEEDRIENIVVGDSGGWQVTANKRGDHLVIKPALGASATDLVVTTDNRRYVFLLQPSVSLEAVPFVVRFDYHQEAPAVADVISPPLAAYKLRGDRSLFPAAISDDGKRTTITWGHDTPLPAIFASDPQGREAIVNGRMVDDAYVIEGVAPRYVFRLGKAQAIATRRCLKEPR